MDAGGKGSAARDAAALPGNPCGSCRRAERHPAGDCVHPAHRRDRAVARGCAAPVDGVAGGERAAGRGAQTVRGLPPGAAGGARRRAGSGDDDAIRSRPSWGGSESFHCSRTQSAARPDALRRPRGGAGAGCRPSGRPGLPPADPSRSRRHRQDAAGAPGRPRPGGGFHRRRVVCRSRPDHFGGFACLDHPARLTCARIWRRCAAPTGRLPARQAVAAGAG